MEFYAIFCNHLRERIKVLLEFVVSERIIAFLMRSID
jgi:hypothetical protein